MPNLTARMLNYLACAKLNSILQKSKYYFEKVDWMSEYSFRTEAQSQTAGEYKT